MSKTISKGIRTKGNILWQTELLDYPLKRCNGYLLDRALNELEDIVTNITSEMDYEQTVIFLTNLIGEQFNLKVIGFLEYRLFKERYFHWRDTQT